MFRLNLNPFYAPEGGGSTPAIDDDASATNKIDALFNEDELEDEPAKDLEGLDDSDSENESDKDDSEEAEETLEDELEADLKGAPDDKLAYMEPVRRKELLKDYPDLFKKHPYLEHAMYREQAYTELFATPAEAKEAYESAQVLDNFDTALMRGEIKDVFRAVKESDPNAFAQLVDNLMGSLGEVDEGAQVHIITNVARHIVGRMFEEAENNGQEALKHAAIILHQFATGSSKYTPPQKFAKDAEKKDESLDKERREFQNQRFEATRSDVIQKLDGKITATLNKRLDPKDSMPEFVKEAALGKAKKELQRVISSDTRFQNVMKQAWARAAKSNFSSSDVALLTRAYETKAADLLPTIINKVRAEALKGLSRRDKSDENESEIVIREPQKRGPVAAGKSTTPNGGKSIARENMKQPPKGMNVRNFLMSDD